MFKNLYAVHDTVSDTIISGIIMEVSDPPAIRAFYDGLKARGSSLAEHPADYNLLLLGNIDTNTGVTIGAPTGPIIVATGSGWLATQQVKEEK